MNSRYAELRGQPAKTPKKWLVTGVAVFIGSSLLKALFQPYMRVIGKDDSAMGHL